ncbi:MAG: hypothetical protein AAB602_02215 [Patescibacteria group bacterium]
MTRSRTDNDGFVALTSVLLISVVLLLMVATLSLSGYIGRFNVLNSELKKVSAALAEACANTAVLKLAEDWSYAGNETIATNGNTCKIFSVSAIGSNPQIFEVQAIYQEAYTNLRIRIQKTPFAIVSWNEVPNLP